MHKDWVQELPLAVTVTDKDGNIIEMNDKSAATFAKQGGKGLIGRNVMEIHPPKACDKIKEIMATKKTNSYTIEKNGVKKLVYQTVWYQDGQYAGLVELSMELPLEMPHFVRT